MYENSRIEISSQLRYYALYTLPEENRAGDGAKVLL